MRRRRWYIPSWKWIAIPLAALLVFAFVGWVGVGIFLKKYERRAEEFDLTEMRKMESASILYDRNGKPFGKLFIQDRQPVPYDKIAPMMVKAVIAAEDNKFYEHDGVDYFGVMRAAITNYRRGKISQGASTVTQQLARNSFDLKERTYERKLVEMFLARRIEKKMSKKDIMEAYLNRVYFGSGFYGVEAASRGYFGKPASELSIGQCAMLAGLLKSPQALSPWNNIEGATATRNFVLGRMNDLGFITKDQLREETMLKLYAVRRTNPFKISYPVELIRQQAVKALGFDSAMNGGYRIETTLDSSLQKVAERAVRDHLGTVEGQSGYSHPTYDQYKQSVKAIEEAMNKGDMSVKFPEPRYLQGAALAIDNNDGGVLAMVGGREFKHSEYNRVFQGRRPAGTVFTPITFAAAYNKGIFPGEILQDACIDNRYVMVGGETGILGEWGVEKVENEYEGPMTTREALVKGKNAAAVRLGMMVGTDALKKTAASMGITSPIRDYANSFLGSSEVTLDELVLAFSVFPNLGQRPADIHIINRILRPDGTVVYEAPRKRVPAISAAAAFQTHAALSDIMREGVGSEAVRNDGLGAFPVAGKPGTAYNFTDTYFIGYTSAVTCGVWVGFDKPTQIYRGAFGKDLALPIWAKIMNQAARDFPASPLPKPDELKEVEICQDSGLLATPGCKIEYKDPTSGITSTQSLAYVEYATDAEMPRIRCDIHGGGIRSFAKEFDEAEWPRASAAVDLSTIRPVAVTAPTLLGFNDVYQSVRPGGRPFQEGDIPVAKAIAVDGAKTGDDAAKAQPTPAGDSADAQAKPAQAEPEVRRAEAIQPLDAPIDSPAINLPPPAPMNF